MRHTTNPFGRNLCKKPDFRLHRIPLNHILITAFLCPHLDSFFRVQNFLTNRFFVEGTIAFARFFGLSLHLPRVVFVLSQTTEFGLCGMNAHMVVSTWFGIDCTFLTLAFFVTQGKYGSLTTSCLRSLRCCQSEVRKIHLQFVCEWM